MIRLILIACLALLLPGGRAGALDAVALHPDTQHAEVYQKIWFLLDDTGALSLDQVIAAPEKFQRNTSNNLNFGAPGPVIWLRLDVANVGARDGAWLFASRQTQPEILEIYLRKNGVTQLLFTAADSKAATASLQRYFAMVAPFSLNAGEAATLYAKYVGTKTSRMPLSISSFEDASAARLDKYLINGIIAAIIIALVAYSTAIFIIISGRIIVYYAIAEIVLTLTIMETNGLLGVLVWPESIFLQRFGLGIMNALYVIFTILFTRSFFQLRQRAPKTDLALRIWQGVALFYLLLTLLLHPQQDFQNLHIFLGYTLQTLLWVFLPLLAVAATWRWDKNYWPLIPGWTVVISGHLYWVLILRGLVPEPPFHPQLIGFIAVANAFFLSMAIVLQVRQRQRALDVALHEQLAAANARAELLRDLSEQDRLVRAAGHDTRAILLGLRSFAAGLEQNPGRTGISVAANAITHLTNDLEAVLGTTIASAAHMGGENALALEHAPLMQVMGAVRLIHERLIREKGLRFSVRSGNHELVMDRPLLARILGNLVENAYKYTQQGGIVLAARKHGDSLRIQVWDSGCGIAPDLLRVLLNPAAGRLRATEQGEGQGSGLQIAKALAARIGGRINACSRPGHGSMFELIVPLTFNATAAGRCLWILENSPGDAAKTAALAQDAGLACDYISADDFNARTDISALPENDLILIDLNFGGAMGGRDAAQRLVAAGTPHQHIMIGTYERGVEMRAQLAPCCGTLIYLPLSTEALQFVFARHARPGA